MDATLQRVHCVLQLGTLGDSFGDVKVPRAGEKPMAGQDQHHTPGHREAAHKLNELRVQKSVSLTMM